MPSDFPRIRYALPKFHCGYTAMMKTLASSLKYQSSDPAQFRLHVLEHGKQYGVASTLAAFGISRRTYFYWQSNLAKSRGRLVSLVPQSTRPHHTRRMVVDDRLLTFIQAVRETYGRIGKEKLKVLISAYAESLGIVGYGTSKIGKIITRNHYFFDPPKKRRQPAFSRSRVRRVSKDIKPGYVEMDSIILYVGATKLRFVTIVDVVTKVAFGARVKSPSSAHALAVLQQFQTSYPISIHTIQTDNGSEFLGEFHAYLEDHNLSHLFTYPRSPKVNGVVERFNRTIQEECIERCDEYWFDLQKADSKLSAYLDWYNEVRPHASLNYQTPLAYAKQYM